MSNQYTAGKINLIGNEFNFFESRIRGFNSRFNQTEKALLTNSFDEFVIFVQV